MVQTPSSHLIDRRLGAVVTNRRRRDNCPLFDERRYNYSQTAHGLILLSRWRLPIGGGDLVAHVPEIFVEPAFHSLLQDLHRRPHGADDAASDDSFGELEMVEAEKLHAFVEVEQALGDIVQAEEFFVTAVEFADGKPGAAKLFVKSVAEARADVEQRKESGRVEAAAVPQAGANQVIVVGSNGLQNVQQADGRFEQLRWRAGSGAWLLP